MKLLLAFAVGALAANDQRPVISLDLGAALTNPPTMGGPAFKVTVNGAVKAIPTATHYCHKKAEWDMLLRGGSKGFDYKKDLCSEKYCCTDGGTGYHEIYAKECKVLDDTASSCAIPAAKAFDHHNGDISSRIVRDEWAGVLSYPSTLPKAMSPGTVTTSAGHTVHRCKESSQRCNVDWNVRGEYLLRYQAVDDSGNKAEPVEFAMIMRDHVAPFCRTTLVKAFSGIPDATVESMDGNFWEQYYLLPNTLVPKMDKNPISHIKKALEKDGQSYCKKNGLCFKDAYDGVLSGDRIEYILTYPDGTPYPKGENHLPGYNGHIELDTTKVGKHTIQVKAHDWANIFGLRNQDNVGSCSTKITVVDTTAPFVFCKLNKHDTPRCSLKAPEGVSAHVHDRPNKPTLYCTNTVSCTDAIQHECEEVYEEPGAICIDSLDSFVSNLDDLDEFAIIPKITAIDAGKKGVHQIKYSCTDFAGNVASSTRKITVDDKTPPELYVTESTELNYIMTFNCGAKKENSKVWKNAITLGKGYTSKEACHKETPDCSLELFEDNCNGEFKCKDARGNYVDCEGEGKLVTDSSGKACEVGGKTDTCFAAFSDEEYFTGAPKGGKEVVTFGLKYTCKNSNDLSISKCRTIELQNTDLCNPQPIHCELSAWSAWDSCSKSCGQGTQQRARKVVVQPKYQGKTCDHLNEWQNCNNQACPVDCEVGTWSAWSECPVSCDGGIATRTRKLTAPKWGGKACRPHKEQMACNTVPCEVDCVYEWLAWSACTKSCNTGSQFRHPRITVAGRHGGLECPDTETRKCNLHSCPRDCRVASWTSWTSCSHSCGGGSQNRKRTVTEPELGGKICPGTSQEQKCNVHPCPIDCEVASWGSWSACDGSCTRSAESLARDHCDGEHPMHAKDLAHYVTLAQKQIPSQIRTRLSKEPMYGGKACPASQVRQHCNRHNCPEDCLYGDSAVQGCLSHDVNFGWSEWSECSESCETGTQYRSRTTRDPIHGGKICLEDRQYRSCNHQKCPVDCEVGSWGGFDECTTSCGGGTQTRTRSFTAPVFGGKACPSRDNVVPCNTQRCPVDCVPAAWDAWVPCTKSCGGGSQTRTRGWAVNPQNGGKACPTHHDSRKCNTHKCPTDCEVGKWGAWDTCTLSCGTGSQTRTRMLNQPKLGGKSCPASFDVRDCNSHECPVDCVLGPAYWTTCTKECTGTSLVAGTTNHQQNIVQPKYGGAACPTTSGGVHVISTKKCNTHRCAIDCTVSAWTAYSTCSLSCGSDAMGESGTQGRTRKVLSKEAHGGVCPDLFEQRSCNAFPCPVDCEVYNWSPYSPCTKSCAGGTQKRTRELVKPLNGGKACPESEMSQSCNKQSCPTDCVEHTWSAFGACDKSCGGGFKTRTRTFTEPTFGGMTCGPATDKMACNTHSCPVDCIEVEAWGAWSPCTKSCNGGVHNRDRKMNGITKFGGACASEHEHGVLCNTHACPVDCEYTYSAWSACSQSCGTEGKKTRTRITDVWPQEGGVECPALKETASCNVKECPVDCVPGYGSWGACSTSCGPGTQTRSVTTKGPFHGGKACPTGDDVQSCNIAPCPADCEVGTWSSFAACTKTCNKGADDIELAVRTRKITSAAKFGGRACATLSDSKICNAVSCPINCEVGAWGVFGACDATCGSGSQTRYRSNTEPMFGGNACPASFSTRPCNTYSCGKTVLVVVTVTSTMDGISKHDFTCQPRLDDGSRNTACPEDPKLRSAFDKADKSMQQDFIDAMFATLGISGTIGGDDVALNVISCTCTSTAPACVSAVKPAHCGARRLIAGAASSFLVIETGISTSDPAQGASMKSTANSPVFAKDLSSNAGSGALAAVGEHAYTFKAGTTKIVVDDCVISDWTAWGSCSKTCGGGLRHRSRQVTQIATKSGAVSGVACPTDEFAFKNVLGDKQTISEVCSAGVCPVECKVAAWASWGACDKSCAGGSQTRFRKVVSRGKKSISVCPDLTETRSCNKHACPTDCVFSYGRWSGCSATCGAAKKTRTNKVTSRPTNGGKACPALVETTTEGCSTVPCPVDCKMSVWGAWSTCSKTCGGGAQSRTRTFIKPKWGGKKCGADVSYQNCNEAKCPVNCKATYGMWTECSKTCGTGVQTRKLFVKVAAKFGGKACPREATTRSCNAHTCPEDCKVGRWSLWSTCSASCGSGSRTRTRTLTTPKYGGKPCPTASETDRTCNAHPCPVDCVLGTWSHALISSAACSVSCGHGVKTRTRGIKIAAGFGGKLCLKADMTETAPCDTSSNCPSDCHMSAWSTWSTCTASCLTGSQTRTRTIVKAAAMSGKACGHTHEYASCNEMLCPVDCVVGKWGLWNKKCSKACGGGKQSRTRTNIAPKYDGKACPASIDYQDCNTHSCPIDCEVGTWNAWGHCSKSCGSGRHIRTRTLHAPLHGGAACPPNDSEDKACNTHACPEDCQVGAWSSWTPCDKVCAGGLRSRTRAVTSPLMGGKLCPHTYEEGACNSQACPIDCEIGKWTPGPCSMTCHLGTRMWSAKFTVVDKFGGKTCKEVVAAMTGAGNPHMVVETNPAEGAVKGPLQCVDSTTCPVHCEVSTWSTWGSCGRSCGGGSRTRTRTVTTKAEGAGTVCPALSQTVACDTSNCPHDCEVSTWSKWSPCSASCGNANKQHRIRKVTQDKHPVYGGAECPTLFQEQFCNTHKCPTDGHYASGWGAWSTCSVSCGTGTQERKRTCTAPTNGGKACPMPSAEKRPCSLANCPRDCELSDWEAWTTCSATCGTGMQTRKRSLSFAPSFGGKACKHLNEKRACNAHACPVNCNVGGWQSWTVCSLSCGTGSQTRTRSIVAPKNGGVTCPSATHTRDCNTHKCPVDCEVEAWGTWTSCTLSCGTGIQTRTRVTLAPISGGKGCPHDIHYRSCNTHKCPIDCDVGAWTAWSSCTKSCAGGSQVRSRQLTEPAHGGNACGIPKQEQPCNAQPCPVDCNVGKWGAWTTCSTTCGGGKQSRSRTVVSAVAGGALCPASSEQRNCNSGACPADCQVGAWTAWKSCTKSCGTGSQVRRRNTLPPASGGKLCPVSFQSQSCNTQACPVDCNEVYAWTAWSSCSVSCGIGRHGRSRAQEEPKYGGVACGAYTEDRSCTDGPCPVHCEVGAWQAWGSCSKSCATCLVYGLGSTSCTAWDAKGYQKRSRPVVTATQDSTLKDGTVLKGQVCPATLEGQHCNVQECPVDCSVGSWSGWSSCTLSCGTGSQTRTRLNRSPKYGGKLCPNKEHVQDCNTQSCPTNCVVESWQAWGACSTSCGGGSQKRVRTLTSAGFGGKICPTGVDRQRCNEHACPIDCDHGKWGTHFVGGKWANSPTCSVSCGAGTYVLTRTVVQPRYGGSACGATRKVVNCNHGPCPVHCEVGSWMKWGGCSKSCGAGTQSRKRKVMIDFKDGHTCSLADPSCKTSKKAYPGTRCPDLKMEQDCNQQACAIDCEVGAWSGWSTCTTSCGTGSQTRSRTTTSPVHGGKACPVSFQRQRCNTQACAIDCSVGTWNAWGGCSKSCGTGVQTRRRTLEFPQYGGKRCPTASDRKTLTARRSLPHIETSQRQCNAHACPVDCVVSAWSKYNTCSHSCSDEFGIGTQMRTRKVVTKPAFGGKACLHQKENRVCNDHIKCPVDCVGAWQAWEPCSASCTVAARGGSPVYPTQRRWHKVTAVAKHGGKSCLGYGYRECNKHFCPVDAKVGVWTSYGSCTKSCGGGSMTRTRGCKDPIWGGKACPQTVNVKPCNTMVCPTPSPTPAPTPTPTNVPYPVINVIGGDEITVEASTDLSQSYDDEGATCFDTHDGDLTQAVVVMGDIVNLIDAFSDCRHIQYECTNAAGLTSSKVRTVCVEDTTCPSCRMEHASVNTITVEASFPYVDGGATCSDVFDGNKKVHNRYSYHGKKIAGVNVEQTGTYVITYTATDESGNHCGADENKNPRRTVVVADTLKPVIGLKYGGKLIHDSKSEQTSAHATHHGKGFKQQNTKTFGNGQLTTNPADNFFSLMAESGVSSSAFIFGAIASAISGVALFSYATQQRSTSAVADLV